MRGTRISLRGMVALFVVLLMMLTWPGGGSKDRTWGEGAYAEALQDTDAHGGVLQVNGTDDSAAHRGVVPMAASEAEPPAPDPDRAAASPVPAAGAKLVALTFDDGPDGKYTPAVLDILKKYDVKATFFLVGSQVEKYPKMTLRIHDEGHQIGNHSWSHKDLSKLSGKALDDQVSKTQQAIAKAAGTAPDLLRAPYGSICEPLIRYLHGRHLKHVYWTVDTKDWAGTSVEAMRQNVLKHTHPGGIILMHSFGGRKNALEHTLTLLPLVIEDLRKEGYEFATVGEMIDTKLVNAHAVK